MPDEKTVAQKQAEKQTKIQKTAALHKENSDKRAADIGTVKAAYQSERDGLVVQDVLKKARQFRDYHLKVAKDGVGLKGQGKQAVEYTLTPAERLSHLDNASGLEPFIAYVERQIAIDAPAPNEKMEEAAAEADDKGEAASA